MIEQPGVWLCHRNYNKICSLSPISDLKVYVAANSYDEITFTFHKENNGEIFPYWEEIKNLKVVYVENFGYFEIAVDKDDKEDTIKTITGISIEAELAQIILRNLSINGEYDLNKDENFFTENGKTSYKPTVLYNENDPSHSLLHRVLSKAPHWSVGHIDNQITENDIKVSTSAVERKFEFDNISIYDALQEIATELDLVFTFNTANRLVNMYDLNSIGNDTTIFVNKENLANQFTCSSNKDSIKNRFKIVGGDDIITSYVTTVNPNGTQYIDFYSDDQKADMSQELVDKLQEYDELYETNREAYQEASAALYNKIDELNYLKYTKAPVPEKISTTAETEIQKLTSSNIGSVPVSQINQLYKKGADKAVLTIVQILVDYRYTVTIESSVYDSSTQKWTGTFKVANESNPSDMAKSPNNIVLNIVEDEKEDLQNKINKIIGDVDFEDETLEDLQETLKQYSLSYLETYEAMYKECTTILLEQGYGVVTSKFYNLYKEYWQKQKACENEIALRKSEIETVEKELDSAQKAVNDYHQLLNFENFVGETLFKELSCYIREDTYENNNYISDGLSDAECMENAKKLVEAATKELYRASTFQYTYTASLNNLFHNLSFEPFYDQFDLFNWIHAEVDEKHILLRLIGVTFDFANINQIEVEFSEQVKNADGLTDIESILSQAKSMATNYSSTARQAAQGSQSYSDFKTLKEEGLNSALMNIKNSNNEEVVIDSCGINCRSKDVNDEYDGCQLRITGKNMVMTEDDWETARLAIGQGLFNGQKKYGIWCDVLVGDIIAGETLMISNKNQTFIVDKDGIIVKNMKLDMYSQDNKHRILIDPALKSIFNIYNEDEQVFFIDQNGNVSMYGNLYVTNNNMYCNIDMNSNNIIEIGIGTGGGNIGGNTGGGITNGGNTGGESTQISELKEWYRSYDGITIGTDGKWIDDNPYKYQNFYFMHNTVTTKNGRVFLLNLNTRNLLEYENNNWNAIQSINTNSGFGLSSSSLGYKICFFAHDISDDEFLYIIDSYAYAGLIKYNISNMSSERIEFNLKFTRTQIKTAFIYQNKLFIQSTVNTSDNVKGYFCNLDERDDSGKLIVKEWVQGNKASISEICLTENSIYAILHLGNSFSFVKINNLDKFSYKVLHTFNVSTTSTYYNFAHITRVDNIIYAFMLSSNDTSYCTIDLETDILSVFDDVPLIDTNSDRNYDFYTNGSFIFGYKGKLHLFNTAYYKINHQYTRYGNTRSCAMIHYIKEKNRKVKTSEKFTKLNGLNSVQASFQGNYVYKNSCIYALENYQNTVEIKKLDIKNIENGWETFLEQGILTNNCYYLVNSDSDNRLYIFGYYTDYCYCINLDDETKTIYKLSENHTHIAPGTCSFVDEKNNFIYWGGTTTMFYNNNAQFQYNENGFVTGCDYKQTAKQLGLNFLSNFVHDKNYIYVAGHESGSYDIKLYRIKRGTVSVQEVYIMTNDKGVNAASYTICLWNGMIYFFRAYRGVLNHERVVYDIEKDRATTYNDMFEDFGGYIKLLEYLDNNVSGDSQSRTTSMPVVSTDVGIFFFTQYPYSTTNYQDMPALNVYLYKEGVTKPTIPENPNEAELPDKPDVPDIDLENPLGKKIFYIDNQGNGYFYGNIYAKDGVFKGDVYANDGVFRGDIIARSLTLGSNVNIDMSHVDGLNDTIDGVVNDLNGKIDGIVDGFGGTIDGINSDLSKVIYKGDIITETADVGNGVIKTTTKVRNNSGGYTENTTYTSADGNYILTNVGLGGDDSGHYCIISKDGLLEAKNAKISGQINASQGYIGGWVIGEDGIYSIDFNTSNSGIKMLSDGQILSKGEGYFDQQFARLYSGKWIFGLGDSFQTEGKRYSDLSADGLYLCSKESLKNDYARYLFAVDTVNDKVSISSQSNNNALEIVNSAGNCLYLSNSRASYENAALKLRVVCSEKEPGLTYIKTGYISIFGEASHGRIVFRADAEGQNNTLNNFTDSAIGTTLYRWGEGYFEELTSSKALNVTSDKKKKNHISYVDKNTALNFVNALMPAMFTMKDNTNQRKHFGFYAQEVAKLAQNMNLGDLSLYNARWIKDGTDYDYWEEADDKELDWSLKYEEFIPLLTSSIQALTKRNEENEKQIESLTHTVNLLLEEMKQLKEELKEVKGLN